MHFFSVVAACLLCSSLAAAGPLPRDRRLHKFRQIAPFKNTTSTADSGSGGIEVVPLSLSDTLLNTATAIPSPGTEISTASTVTTSSTSGFTDTTSPFSSTTATATTSTSPATTTTRDGVDGAQSAIGASQTDKQSITSNLSGITPTGSIVRGTGNLSRTTLGSANSNTDVSADSKPTDGSQLFPFVTSPTNTPDSTSTIAEAPFTFLSDTETPTTLSTQTTKEPVAITITGEGAAVPITPSFFTSTTALPTTTDTPTLTTDKPIIRVPTVSTAIPLTRIPDASSPNVVQANDFNDLFTTLTPDDPCAANSVACINGAFATCKDGRYVLKECTTVDTACYALPMENPSGVVVNCFSIEYAEAILGLPNSLTVTIGSVPVVVPTTTTKAVQPTSVTKADPTTTAGGAAGVTAAAVQSSNSDGGEAQVEAQPEEETTVLHRTIVSTITIAVPNFTPPTVATPTQAATAVAAAGADGSLISVVPVAAAVGAGAQGNANEEEGGEEGPVTVTVTWSVTVTEQFTVIRAGVTATVTRD
ncbi:hypothetical protein O988_09012 [Pseudogymnoascus sp. VKM F-3808]|nr:hypothetical protein O988_09012 [Pseudogymnoascus sp. VKM F-3808]